MVAALALAAVVPVAIAAIAVAVVAVAVAAAVVTVVVVVAVAAVVGEDVAKYAAAAPYTYDLRDACYQHLCEVADKSGDTVFLSIRSGLDGVCIARVEGAFPIKVFVLDVGRRRLLNIGASALAILSTLPDDEIHRIVLANQERVRRDYPRFDAAFMWK